MKKLLLSLAAVAMTAMPMLAESVSITFKKGKDNNQSNWTTSTAVAEVLEEGSEGADVLGAITSANRVSPGMYGLKLGTNKDVGEITFSLSEALNCTDIVVKASLSKGTNQYLSVNGQEFTIASAEKNGVYGTFTVPVGAEMTELVLSKSKSKNDGGVAEGFVFVESVTINYTPGAVDPDALPKPEISLEGRTVTITCSDPDAQIRYTDFDGADIDTDYNVYYAPFELYMPCTVQAVAFKDGKTSGVASKFCNVPVQLPDFSSLPDLPKGTLVEFTEPLAVACQANPYMWLTNGSDYVLLYGYNDTEYAAGDVYQGFTGTTDEYRGLLQIKDYSIGEKIEGMTLMPEPMQIFPELVQSNMMNRYVVINGVTITGSNRSYVISLDGEEASMYDSAKLFLDFVPEADKTYNVTGFVGMNNEVAQLIPVKIEEVQAELPVCEAPMFNPVAGEYTEVTSVILSCATEGAAIYYTLDGTEPTVESTEYTAPIALSVDGVYTVKAIAVAEGHSASEVATAVYTIKVETGIDAVEVVEGEAEYFNLQGVRVANPTPGLYILRSAGKVVKVQVK